MDIISITKYHSCSISSLSKEQGKHIEPELTVN